MLLDTFSWILASVLASVDFGGTTQPNADGNPFPDPPPR